jgi:hypothetical protein
VWVTIDGRTVDIVLDAGDGLNADRALILHIADPSHSRVSVIGRTPPAWWHGRRRGWRPLLPARGSTT